MTASETTALPKKAGHVDLDVSLAPCSVDPPLAEGVNLHGRQGVSFDVARQASRTQR